MQDAWKVYQPVGLPGVTGQVATPSIDQVLASYQEESTRYIESATYPQIQKFQAEIQASGSVAAMNSLGVMYAKYGHLDKAEGEFKQALQQKPFLPAVLNLGNLYFIQNQWKQALQYYQQALGMDPKNPHVILAIAKADQQLSKFDDMRQKYDQLKTLDPVLADQYAYLGQGSASGARAADIATQRREVLWEGQ
jgi:tetratricopeptide (TPR) repeat protein